MDPLMLVLHWGSLYRKDMDLAEENTGSTRETAGARLAHSLTLWMLASHGPFLPCGARDASEVEKSSHQAVDLQLMKGAQYSHGRPLTPA